MQILHNFPGIESLYDTSFFKAIAPGIRNFYVGGIHRPPNRSNVEFPSYIESVLQNLGNQ